MKAHVAHFVGLLPLVGLANGQQFADVTLGHTALPGLSKQCHEALNMTVQNCPGFLAAHSVNMPRLTSPLLDALCTDNCRLSLMTVRAVIDWGCSAETDVVEMGRVVYPATYMIDRMLHAFHVSCAADSAAGMYCDEIYLERPAGPARTAPWRSAASC